MTDQALRNSAWIGKVRQLLREGQGVEDIALKLKCDVTAVRSEVSILRELGELEGLYK